jgi:hypothetical protein
VEPGANTQSPLCLHKWRDPDPTIALRRQHSLPFQQLQVLFTLYSEFFASFPHGTYLLSVSHRVFSLGWSIPPGFRLHSQAARLCDSIPLCVHECSLIPFSESVSTGLSPSLAHLSRRLETFETALDLGLIVMPQFLAAFPLSTEAGSGDNWGFQAWAFPCSLAVSKGISVVFFSSAY